MGYKLRLNYKYMQQIAPEKFELVFVSSDTNASMMETYMQEDQMPWPALKYGKRGNGILTKYKGSGIPCLVVTDRYGRLLFHSYHGDEYAGPDIPRKQLEAVLKSVVAVESNLAKEKGQ